MNVFAANRVHNMQRDLIIEKTEGLLSNITCSQDSKEYLKTLIVELVTGNFYSMKKNQQWSVYQILKIRIRQNERTILNHATKAIEDIQLDNETRNCLNSLGIQGEIKVAKFLKAAAQEVQKQVEQEKIQKGTWIG